MSGFDPVRVPLGEPYAEFWVEVAGDPPIAKILELDRLLTNPKAVAELDQALALLREFVVDDNLPVKEWTTATVGGKLVAAISEATERAWAEDGGASADPLPTGSSEPS